MRRPAQLREVGSQRPEKTPPRGAEVPREQMMNVFIMAIHAGSPKQPVEKKGCLGDPTSLTGLVTVQKGVDVMMVAC